MRITVLLCLALMHTHLSLCAAIPRSGWSKLDFPASIDGRIYDPDDVLSSSNVKALEARFSELETNMKVPSGEKDGTAPETIDIQMAAVVVKRINTVEFRNYEDPEMSTIEDLAWHLHDHWGVGYDSKLGGSGVLVVLSTQDRVMYISRGGAVEPYLTNSRIDRIILNLKPFLRARQYGDALTNAADMVQHFIESGKPSWWEQFVDFLPNLVPVGMVALVGGVLYAGIRKQQNENREYARVRSELNRLDRAQAEALRGQYRATSCPICLEDFISQTIGSDEQPIKLLRCGHVFDESCWAEWVSSGTGNVTRCPICQRDVGTGTHAPSMPNTARGEGGQDAQNGPNRRPNVRPAAAAGAGAAAGGNENEHDHGGDAPQDDNTNNHQPDHQHRHHHYDNNVHDRGNNLFGNNYGRNNDWMMRQFRRERNFRLMRLARQYPRYIQQNQLQRWTQSTYDGTLSTDRSFVQNDPRVVREAAARKASSSGSRSRSGSSFGGGGSAGGRGGRW